MFLQLLLFCLIGLCASLIGGNIDAICLFGGLVAGFAIFGNGE